MFELKSITTRRVMAFLTICFILQTTRPASIAPFGFTVYLYCRAKRRKPDE
jgi:hypothetical protein